MLKAVSFDIGGTLIDFSKECSLRKKLMQTFDINPDIFQKAYLDHFERNIISKRKFCELIQCFDEVRLDRIIADYYKRKPLGRLYGDTLSVIKELKLCGLRLITISNKAYCNPSNLAKYDLNTYFDAEIYSCDVGSAKPDQEIYMTAERAVNMKPNEIIHIGDSIRSDIMGPKAVGWHTILLLRTSKNMNSTESDYIATDLTQALEFIKQRL